MTTIIPALIEHIPFITQQLSSEYRHLNEESGYPIYKTDSSFFAQIVESRIRTTESEFKYFVLTEENWEVLGFISLLQKKRGEILMISLKNQNKANLTTLLSFGIDFLKENGSEFIVFESAPQESEYQEALKTLWAKKFSSKFIL